MDNGGEGRLENGKMAGGSEIQMYSSRQTYKVSLTMRVDEVRLTMRKRVT